MQDPDCLYIEPCFEESITLLEMFKIMHEEEFEGLKDKEEEKEVVQQAPRDTIFLVQ